MLFSIILLYHPAVKLKRYRAPASAVARGRCGGRDEGGAGGGDWEIQSIYTPNSSVESPSISWLTEQALVAMRRYKCLEYRATSYMFSNKLRHAELLLQPFKWAAVKIITFFADKAPIFTQYNRNISPLITPIFVGTLNSKTIQNAREGLYWLRRKRVLPSRMMSKCPVI